MTNKNLTQLELDFITSKKAEGKTVIVNGNVVIVKYNGEKGVAYCNPEDTFDITVGYKVACLKIKLQNLQKYQDHKRSQKNDFERKYKKELDSMEIKLQQRNKELSQLKHKIKNPSKIKEKIVSEISTVPTINWRPYTVNSDITNLDFGTNSN